jgi:ABC-2 type transport system ATP-binding protein
MLITLEGVRVGHGPTAALPETTLSFGPGIPTVFAVDSEQRPTVLSLVAAGRMRVDAGTVTPADLRDRVALVDTPLVAEPPAEVRASVVVREELTLAGRRGSATEYLRERGLIDFASAPFAAIPPVARLSLLLDLALLRPGIEAVVVTSPERHGVDTAEWWRLAREIGERGVAVLVVTDQASVDAIARLPHPESSALGATPLFEESWNSEGTWK